MPKEIVRNRVEIDDGALPWLELGWSKGTESGHVQVGVVGPEAHFKLFDGEGNEIPSNNEGVGLFVQLDRAGINQAIRHLRKARDDAYGRDE